MKLKTAIITLITIFTSSILLANTLSLGDNSDGTWNVNYSSDGEIGGFQFNVDGATINSASGGASGDAGFMVSASATTALGFSLSGATLPSGDGVLVVLNLAGTPGGLSGIVISDPSGQDMGFTYDAGDGGSGWDGDACSMPDHTVHLTSGGSVLFNSSSPVAGFQMDVDGATISSASGGEAGAAGFMISAGENTVLGFSLSGATFDGCGTMVELQLDGEATGLSGIIISDSGGQALPFEYFDGSDSGGEDVYGCMDMDACNYNPDATTDDDSCTYAEENYDCDGNCTAIEDCAGVCGGVALEDECGVCDGDGADVMCEDGSYVCDESDCESSGDWDGDACSMPDHTVHLTSGGSVLFNSSSPVAGFQMDVGGVIISCDSDGEAGAAGFII